MSGEKKRVTRAEEPSHPRNPDLYCGHPSPSKQPLRTTQTSPTRAKPSLASPSPMRDPEESHPLVVQKHQIASPPLVKDFQSAYRHLAKQIMGQIWKENGDNQHK